MKFYICLQARHFADGEKEMTGSRITFAKATRHHSGIYNCSADNGYSPMPPGAHKLITLDVHRKFTYHFPHIIMYGNVHLFEI